MTIYFHGLEFDETYEVSRDHTNIWHKNTYSFYMIADEWTACKERKFIKHDNTIYRFRDFHVVATEMTSTSPYVWSISLRPR